MGFLAADQLCRCARPRPTRSYYRRWVCLCGQFIVERKVRERIDRERDERQRMFFEHARGKPKGWKGMGGGQ